ncbi:MAG: hypothetical protein HY512_02930 [Candidatus Aenigmarchaeota archaeon]|nr:hypothetical protein [Candidatus Aenigmarchaeota archaeon]
MIAAFVEGVLGYLDVSEKERRSVCDYLVPRLQREDEKDQEKIYRRVTNWIDVIRTPRPERNHWHLEHRDGDGKVFVSLGSEDNNLQVLFNGQNTEKTIMVSEALDVLKSRLDDLDFKLLQQLFSRVDGELALSLSGDRLAENAELIQSRIRELAQTYERDGRIVIPRRPIIHIEFNPLYVKYGRRRYNGNPLAFFLQHQDVYGEMSRGQLRNFDPGLYHTLRRQGLLQKAIPEIYLDRPTRTHTLPKEEQQRIAQKLAENNGFVAKTAKDLGYDPNTVKKYGKVNGVQLVDRSNQPLEDAQVAEIMSAFPVYDGSAYRASRHLPYSYSAIYKRWKRAGLI